MTRGEIVESIDLPIPMVHGAAFGRITRRRGVDLATINLCGLVDRSDGNARFAFGAVGPTAFVASDESARWPPTSADVQTGPRHCAALVRRGASDHRRARLAVNTGWRCWT